MHIERNPFQYGRELGQDELVDRANELAEIERVIRNRAKLFVIGPRRYGKTSLLAVAAARAAKADVLTIRLDAEKYESLPLLAEALLTAAIRGLEGPIERMAKLVGKVGARLRPEVVYDPQLGTWSVTVGAAERKNTLPLLTDALDTIEQLALDADREVVVMLDEVQQIVIEHGLAAEKQLRATVQKHSRTSYIFAGSATRLLNEMTSDANRPFYRLGSRLFVSELPRGPLIEHLREGFASVTSTASADVCTYLIERASDVPYNVQRLAYEAWEILRSEPQTELTVELVDRALRQIVLRDDPAYTQLWTSLTKKNQKKALRMVAGTGGVNVFSAESAQAYGLASGSVQRAVAALLERNLIRPVPEGGATRYVLVDPFLAEWLAV